MKRTRSMVMVLSAAVFSCSERAAYAQIWPIEPTPGQSPFGSSFGEYSRYGSAVSFHSGVDIVGQLYNPLTGTGPWVKAVTRGTVWVVVCHPGDTQNQVVIRGDDGLEYRYGHLEYQSLFDNALHEGDVVNAGDPIARIMRWPYCGFNHLHYDVRSSDHSTWHSPLSSLPPPPVRIGPHPDPTPPDIDDIVFAEDDCPIPGGLLNRWAPFAPVAGSRCTPVKGKIDIVVMARDRDETGASLLDAGALWVRNVRWRACPEMAPAGAWEETRPFDTMPASWGSTGGGAGECSVYYSSSLPWVSNWNYCTAADSSAAWFYAVVTNFVPSSGGPALNASGCWTPAVDGTYTVSVKLTDFAGRTSVARRRVCVNNGGPCKPELTIRDCVGDDGAIPSPASFGWLSPDIKVNPATLNEDRRILIDQGNRIEVTFWNYGCAVVPAGTIVSVSLRWYTPSPTLLGHPAGSLIGSKSVSVPADLPVGGKQVVPFDWTPPSTTPAGYKCLKASIALADDPLLSTVGARWDDNQAQRAVTFVALPAPAPPAAPSSSRRSVFWLNPLAGVGDRALQLRFRYPSGGPNLARVRLHVGPGLLAGAIHGGRIIGGYKGDEPLDPDTLSPTEPCMDGAMSWAGAMKLGCTRVIGDIDPEGILRIEGVSVEAEPVRLLIEARTAAGVPAGRISDVEIVEEGVPPGHGEATELGGLMVRFEH